MTASRSTARTKATWETKAEPMGTLCLTPSFPGPSFRLCTESDSLLSGFIVRAHTNCQPDQQTAKGTWPIMVHARRHVRAEPNGHFSILSPESHENAACVLTKHQMADLSSDCRQMASSMSAATTRWPDIDSLHIRRTVLPYQAHAVVFASDYPQQHGQMPPHPTAG